MMYSLNDEKGEQMPVWRGGRGRCEVKLIAALVVAARVSDQHPLRTQAPSRIDDGTKTVAEEIDVAGGADEVGPAAARAGE